MNLKEFLNIYGTNTTNNFQLLNWGKKLKIKNLQVLMIDEIRACSIKKPINIIVNIDNSNERGSHWSCFHKTINDKKFFFDSYGLPPQKKK